MEYNISKGLRIDLIERGLSSEAIELDKLMARVESGQTKETTKVTPRKQLGFKVNAGLSTNQLRYTAQFIKQNYQKVFVSSEEEELASHQFKPKSTSYKLYARDSDQLLKVYTAPVLPEKPNTKTDAEQNNEYREAKETYVKSLNPSVFQEKFSKCREQIQPHMLMVVEKYEHCLAAGVYDLKKHVLSHIKANLNQYIPGTVDALVEVYDGADGFGDLKLLAQRNERANPDHGITVDFTIHRIKLKPNKQKVTTQCQEPLNKKRKLEKGPTLVHWSSVAENDDLDVPRGQRQTRWITPSYTDSEEEKPETVITVDAESEKVSVAAMDGFDDDLSDEKTDSKEADNDFQLAFQEKKTESSKNTRPIARGCLNENDQYSTTQLIRDMELQRKCLTEDIDMDLDIGEGYNIRIR